MSDLQYLCDIHEVREDKATIVQIGKRSIGVFKLNDGSIHALLNLCPHKGAALCEGPGPSHRAAPLWGQRLSKAWILPSFSLKTPIDLFPI